MKLILIILHYCFVINMFFNLTLIQIPSLKIFLTNFIITDIIFEIFIVAFPLREIIAVCGMFQLMQSFWINLFILLHVQKYYTILILYNINFIISILSHYYIASRREKLPPVHTECSICLNLIISDYYNLECKHLFHSMCLDEWAKQSPTCPLCRNTLLD